MSSSNFHKVLQFNQAFGVDCPDSPRPNLFDEKPETVRLKIKMIVEEVNELLEACAEKDPVEALDALADILYVVYGAGLAFGFDMNEAFDRVHRSNMSKMCDTLAQAQATVESYKEQRKQQGISFPYDSPAFRKNESCGKYVIYNVSSGKILKSKDYQPVQLRDLVWTHDHDREAL